jgi:hypothetical protein
MMAATSTPSHRMGSTSDFCIFVHKPVALPKHAKVVVSWPHPLQ